MSGYAISQKVVLETESCCVCGVLFAMPDHMLQRLRDSGGNFYCPNGHSQRYMESETTRLRKKLAEQTRIATQMAERAVTAQKAERKSLAELNRIKKRVSAGVCPCCNRTFQQLARHMKAKHPGHEQPT